MNSAWKWSLAVLAFAWLAPAGELSARDDTWHGPDGEVISRGDYFGVRGGQVILSEGSNKKFFALSAFSLEDRDALIELMKRRKHDIKIAELMQFENLKGQPRPAAGGGLGDVPGEGDAGVSDGSAEEPADSDSGESGETGASGAAAILSIGETTSQVYGLPVPFPGLLEEAPSRTWTSLLGQQVPAVFEELVAPAHVRLRVAGGRSNTFALANFVRADIDWLKEAITADAQKDVFPATATAEAQPLTPEQTEKKYRTWTDRKGRKLNAAFSRVDGKQVVLDTDAGPQSFALIGISGGDRDWIRQEMLRRAEESRRRQEEAQRQAEQTAAAGNSGASRPGSGGPFGRGNPFERSFRCSRCGHEWTGTRIAEPCPNCIEQAKQREAEELAGYEDRRSSSSSLFSYKFECDKCGHKWVSDSAFDTCPNCHGRGNGGGDGGGHGEGESYADTGNGSDSSNNGLPAGYEDRRTNKHALHFYQFDCEKCGHKWIASTQFDRCPHGCTGRRGPVGIVVAVVAVIAGIVSFVIKAARS